VARVLNQRQRSLAQNLLDADIPAVNLPNSQGTKIACPEEIAYNMGFIDRERLVELAKSTQKSGYGDYLLRIIEADS
jgi:glucose-1-phosphate thymidylyltransferase